MNILLIDIDSKIVNLALKKIEMFYQTQGHSVVWNMPLFAQWADRIYVSCVFTENAEQCKEWERYDHASIGGSGYDLLRKLPVEIEDVKPHIDLGFTTRGCIRHCPFCIVPQKEGNFRIVGDLLDLWSGQCDKITLLDNNILADPIHFKMICKQARENSILVDFNQGLDHRLLTPEIVDELVTIRHREYRFAFDSVYYLSSVQDALQMLQSKGLRRSFWYVLVGYNTTYDEDRMRLDFLHSRDQTVFVQRYKKTKGNLLLGQWANQHHLFKTITFEDFLKIRRFRNYYLKYRDEIQPYFDNCSE